MNLDFPFIPGILILLFIYIVFIRWWMKIANFIGRTVRIFLKALWETIKGVD